MVADISGNDSGPAALLEAIARQAARASRPQLTILLALAIGGTIGAALTLSHGLALGLAIAALSAAVAVLALWELWRRSPVRPTRARAAVQAGLAALGVLLWFLGGMALLLALLGDSWKL